MQLDAKQALKHYNQSKRRLLVLGYNATLTTAVEAPRQPKRHFDQIKVLSRLQTASVSASVNFQRHRKLTPPCITTARHSSIASKKENIVLLRLSDCKARLSESLEITPASQNSLLWNHMVHLKPDK